MHTQTHNNVHKRTQRPSLTFEHTDESNENIAREATGARGSEGACLLKTEADDESQGKDWDYRQNDGEHEGDYGWGPAPGRR